MDPTRQISPLKGIALLIPFLCTIGLFGQGFPLFLEQSRSDIPEERVAAYEEMAMLQGPEVESALAAGIADPSPLVRQAAAMAAIGHTSEVVTTALVAAFHDQSLEVQHTAISVFIMNNRTLPAGYRPLLSLLEAPDPSTRAYAAWAVGLYRNPGSIKRLQKLFDGGTELQRANACWAVGEIGHAEGLALVSQGLTDKAASVREKAAGAAEKIGDSASMPRLRSMVKAESVESVRQAGQRGLAAIRETEQKQ